MNTANSRMLKVREVAHRLFISEKSVRRLIEADELRCHKIGRQIRVSEDDFAAFVAVRRV